MQQEQNKKKEKSINEKRRFHEFDYITVPKTNVTWR